MEGPFSGLCEICDKHLKDLYGEKIKEHVLLKSLSLKHEKCAEALIKAGADLNWLLLNALKNSDVEDVNMLIQAGADVNQCYQQMEYPIQMAVIYPNAKCVDTLIQSGASVNQCQFGSPALITAAAKGLYDIVDLLIKGGADVNMTDDNESTALNEASKFSPSRLCQSASKNNLIKCIDTLIKAGADVNTANRYGITPLIRASESGFCEAICLLLQSGADVNHAANHHGVTPLIRASQGGFYDAMLLLLQAGADVNTASSELSNPLLEAAAFGQWECVKSIFSRDFPDRLQDKTVERKYLRCVKLLLRSGANIGEISSRIFLTSLLYHIDLLSPHESREMCLLLFAAGETLNDDPDDHPDCLKFEHLRLCLKHLCRERIRTHLLQVNPRKHLFGRVQSLGLPHLLTKYLVYDMSLDDDDDQDYDDDDDGDRS